ncbi:hypothetical protein NPIL_569141 [Nephila pilipes]|uniref:Uncharacterized protein n=1 Tax=Nephila pilipes TaxID=299642 RepID=A0A8X6TBS1_NEPPI|nr:hypothetical protein NPIL_569141 [Nephila pilipes]
MRSNIKYTTELDAQQLIKCFYSANGAMTRRKTWRRKRLEREGYRPRNWVRRVGEIQSGRKELRRFWLCPGRSSLLEFSRSPTECFDLE